MALPLEGPNPNEQSGRANRLYCGAAGTVHYQHYRCTGVQTDSKYVYDRVTLYSCFAICGIRVW